MKKKSKSKEAKFFCESCSSEVPRNAKVCPTCGKFFASVRCPKCFATGTNDDFRDGCPRCGYAINPESAAGKKSGNIILNPFGTSQNSVRKSRQSMDWSIFNKKKSTYTYAESGLPIWVYASSVVVLLILMICLYSCL
ncbi:MAG: hypothetical protein HUJ68_08765 [Clostridia bacterium]|nr:hypothetical protein [Clostridia bacterium]